LKPSQFKCDTNPDRYIYSEHGSKNRSGGFYQLHVENKNVEIFRSSENGQPCVFSLLDLYLSKLPPKAIEQNIFYCRALQSYQGEKIWYSAQPRSKHFLSMMVKNMCKDAKIDGDFTNHSLRATGATELFQHEVPEKVIQDITGH